MKKMLEKQIEEKVGTYAKEQASYNDGLISRLSNYIKESTECLP